MKFHLPLFAIAGMTLFSSVRAEQPLLPPQDRPQKAAMAIGGENFQQWSGLGAKDGVATLTLPGEANLNIPAGPKGFHPEGLMLAHDGVIDLRGWYAFRFEVMLDRDEPFEGSFMLSIPPQQERKNWPDSTKAPFRLQGSGWQTVTVPISTFDYNRGQIYFLKFINRITLAGGYESKAAGKMNIRNVRLVRGNVLHLAAPRQSFPGEPGEKVSYPFTVANSSDTRQVVDLSIQHKGWEGMSATISPQKVVLDPGQTATAKLTVTIPADIPPGSQEKQMVSATVQGGNVQPETLEFTTLRRLPYPYLMFDNKGWQAIRDKVGKYDWATKQQEEILKEADQWQVHRINVETKGENKERALYKPYEAEHQVANAGNAWKLSGKREYAEKVALFLREMSDPKIGYPSTLHATTAGIPQEGGFFEGCLSAYDAIYDSGVLSDSDKVQIEHSFRLYVGVVVDMMGDGGISNWSVFNLCPAAMCALAIQDITSYETLMNGPCGLVDQLRYGLMDDGWWYEVTLSYNVGCANVVTSLALAARPFGIDLLNQRFPVSTTSNVGLRPFEYEKFLGMAFGKYGPVKRNFITIKDMWDGIIIYPDYRGIMFGMGDGHEQVMSGGSFERAYHAFRDPAYAAIIKQGKKRDLFYAVPELPAETPKLYTLSGHSDNAGIAVLRSQKEGRQQREQIQVGFKYGTHGSYHGHFDRLDFLSLMRYGRSFYNPETSWFGYGSYMYKWWIQPSISHNMVVVDGKQQEPQPCTPLLFHSGSMLQISAAETISRWSNPPYMGGYDQIEGVLSGDRPFVKIPENHPKPGDLTDFTEPVRQRRAIIVTDDYVVIADDLHAEKEHQFDNLFQLRGATVGDSFKKLEHLAQFDTNPLSSGQFITNVNRYQSTAPAIVNSVHRIAASSKERGTPKPNGKNWETGGAKSLSEPGELHMDAHVLWPQAPEVSLGDYAESWPVGKKLSYEVKVDGKPLATGTFGAWILGSGEIDTDITGSKSLELTTTVKRGNSKATVFWGNARLVTRDGKELALADLPAAAISAENIMPGTSATTDYEGGPIKIAGNPQSYATAGEPQDEKKSGILRIDLTGLDVVRFKSTVGGDWPVGDEEQLRKTVAVRTKGKQASFLTLIEPFEKDSLIKTATATSPDQLRVELKDGRIQEITINHLNDSPEKLSVEIKESKNGKTLRTEKADAAVAKE